MGAQSCATPLTVQSTQKATTQIAGDLGPNLSLLCSKMDGLDRDQGKKGEGEEEWKGGGFYRMVGIEALGVYPQLGKHLLFIIWVLVWSKAMLCSSVCVSVCAH